MSLKRANIHTMEIMSKDRIARVSRDIFCTFQNKVWISRNKILTASLGFEYRPIAIWIEKYRIDDWNRGFIRRWSSRTMANFSADNVWPGKNRSLVSSGLPRDSMTNDIGQFFCHYSYWPWICKLKPTLTNVSPTRMYVNNGQPLDELPKNQLLDE